jgi:hypothetical protein
MGHLPTDGAALDLQRLQERCDELEAELEYVANAVDSWPDHPWIPGSCFIRDEELRRIIAEHRTAAPFNHSIGLAAPERRHDEPPTD